MVTRSSRSNSSGRLRVSALDTAHSRRRSIVVVGPLVVPPLPALVDRYNAMASLGPTARLCLHPDTDSARWRTHQPDGPAAITEIAPARAGGSATQLISELQSPPARSSAPGVRIVRCGHFLAIDFCHGLGEAALLGLLLEVLFGVEDPTHPAFLDPYRSRVSPLLRAGLRTFGAHPDKVVALMDHRRHRPAHRKPSGTETESPTATDDAFLPALAVRAAGLSEAVIERLRSRRDVALPRVGLNALFTQALWQNLRDAGICVDDVVKIPFDVRRYLGTGAGTLATFSAGLDFTIDAAAGPEHLQRDMDRATECGRPVANLALSAWKARRRSTRPAEHPSATARPQLLHSNVLRSVRTQRWPFTDHRLAQILVASDPIGPDGVTVTSAWSAGNLWFTAQFHDNVVDASRVASALESLEPQAHNILGAARLR